MHERDKERGERDYVKGNQLCFCLKRWKTISQKDCLHKVSVDQRMKTLIHIK